MLHIASTAIVETSVHTIIYMGIGQTGNVHEKLARSKYRADMEEIKYNSGICQV
jgi:hypothetical protein